MRLSRKSIVACLSLVQRESPVRLVVALSSRSKVSRPCQAKSHWRYHNNHKTTMNVLSLETSYGAVEELIAKAKKVADGPTVSEAGIESTWIYSYGTIAQRCEEDRRLGISRYPY